MGSGYVLDFTNRKFAEFILDTTGRNIYDPRYDNTSGSKAHRLRMFWQKEDNRLVGKLMGDLLDYLGETGPRVEICRLIVARLNGTTSPSQTIPRTQETPKPQLSATLLELQQEFCDLAIERDRAKAGLALEKLLHRLFALFQLHPRQPFRVVGEQIDGSIRTGRPRLLAGIEVGTTPAARGRPFGLQWQDREKVRIHSRGFHSSERRQRASASARQ